MLCAALSLDESVASCDVGGAQTAALSGLSQALAQAKAGTGPVLLAANSTHNDVQILQSLLNGNQLLTD